MFPADYAALVEAPFSLARVSAHDRAAYLVMSQRGELRARVEGKLLRDALSTSELPVIGDYVAIAMHDGGASIVRVLPRTNLFARRGVGGAARLQAIAANLDRLFVVSGLDGDFNLRRIERYLSAAAGLGVPVALVLSKLDLADDAERGLHAARAVAGSVPVLALCALDGRGLAELTAFRGPGRTLGFVGSSGAGKSTLVNALCECNLLATGPVRASDARGRHTTTRRRLLWLSDGTALLDTPGMREFGLPAELGLEGAFDDVAALARACRFRDCTHQVEPGCAVRDAIDPERLANMQRLQREAEFEERKTDRAAALAHKQRWKQIHKAVRRRARYE